MSEVADGVIRQEPALPWRLPAGPGAVIGIDVGGTFIKAALCRASGEVSVILREATHPDAGGDVLLERLAALVEAMARHAEAGDELAAVGIAVPGVVDEEAGVARYSANLGWRDLDVVAALGSRLRLPIVLGHDVRVGALAEGALGAARGVQDYLFVPVGTGIAAAVVLNGLVRRGGHGAAGEIGHLVVEPGGARCGCGGRGCLEAVASAAAIARRYAERVGDHSVDAATVRARAEAGDAEAAAVWQDAVQALGAALGAAHGLLDVELIVVGGGLANAGPVLLSELGDAIASRSTWLTPPRLALATLGDAAASLGAALLARQRGGRAASGQLAPSTTADRPTR